jgi:Flp pilus assembly protein TadG
MNRVSDERGSTTLWTLMLAMSLLALGGISVDLWSALGAHRDLAGVADAAAAAAASEIDQDVFRSTGEVRLDPDAAVATAMAIIGDQANGADRSLSEIALADVAIGVEIDEVTVRLTREVRFVLLQWLSGTPTIEVSAEARSDASLRQ